MITRTGFLRLAGLGPLLTISPPTTLSPPITLPLTLLPNSGLLTATLSLQGRQVQTIVDTGSPFLTYTAAPDLADGAIDDVDSREITYEQYGEDFLKIVWNEQAEVGVLGSEKLGQLSVGAVEPKRGVNSNYLGLVYKDSVRPSVLSQLGFTSFTLSYASQTLRLGSSPGGPKPLAHPLFDFSPWCSNAYFYATALASLCLGEEVIKPPPGRDLVVVVDTGLSGLIIDEECRNVLLKGKVLLGKEQEISLNLMNGEKLNVRNKRLFTVTSYKLPWFDRFVYTDNTPLVVAIGGAYLSERTLIVDTKQMRFSL